MENISAIPLILDETHQCSYFTEKRNAQFIFVHPEYPLDSQTYGQLIEQGFRRSGNYVYQPQCEACQACIQTRLPVAEFQASRQQRRTLNKNSDLTINIKKPEFNQQHFELYQRYQKNRHTGGQMADSSPESYIEFLSSDWCNSQFIEFKHNKYLVAVAIMDIFDNGVSAVYTFFDPTLASRSLGVFSVLWQINYAKSLKLDWLYLGYWIADCQKMAYKTNYQPLQGLINQQWQPITKSKV